MPCQESGRMRGSVGSCPHHGSWPVVLPFGWLIHLVKRSGSVDHRRLGPVNDMVILSGVVGESGFVVFC